MPSTIYDQDWDEERQLYVSSRKTGLPLGPDHPHYPNKSEKAMLRTLMREGQCSEEEVRSRKGNRQKLAEAAKAPMQKGNTNRRELEAKRRRRAEAKRKGVQVWELEAEAPRRNRWDY